MVLFTATSCMNADKKKKEMPMPEAMETPMPPKVMHIETPMRTMGLVTLGTTGNPEPYAMEQMGEYKGKISGAFTSVIKEALTMEEMDMNAGFGGYAPEVAIVNGMTYRMVAPAVVKDNFVVSNGMIWCRYDLGVDEGTNMITMVSHGKL